MPTKMGTTWATLNSQPVQDYIEEDEFNALLDIAEAADDSTDSSNGPREEAYVNGLKESICLFLDGRGVPGVGDTLRRTWNLP